MRAIKILQCFRQYGAVNTKPKGKTQAKQPTQKLKVRLNSASSTESTKSAKKKKDAPFQIALFEEQEKIAAETKVVDEDVLEKRAVISKAWSQLQMEKLKAQTIYEKAFLESKNEALEKLRNLSPNLYEAAIKIDYKLPPLERRLPTKTPPTSLPFSCSFSE